MTQSNTERNRKIQEWKKANKDRINLLFEKGMRARIQEASSMENESVTEYVSKAVEARLTGVPLHKLFSSDKKDLIIEAAKISGLSVKDFIREAVYSKAEEIVKEAKREDGT